MCIPFMIENLASKEKPSSDAIWWQISELVKQQDCLHHQNSNIYFIILI